MWQLGAQSEETQLCIGCNIQWNLSTADTIWIQLPVLYTVVSLNQWWLVHSSMCVVWTAGSVLYREVSFIQGVLHREVSFIQVALHGEVPLYT